MIANLDQCRTIPDLWERVLAEHPEASLFNVAVSEASRFMNYRATSFFRRVSRVALALREGLGNECGSRVAILSETANDLVMALHGTVMGGLVAIPISLSFEDNVVVGLINNSGATTVIFGFEAAARVATLFGRLPAVQHWVVAGGTGRTSLGGGIAKLDDLMAKFSGENFDLSAASKGIQERDPAALLILTRGGRGLPRGVEFSHSQLIAAARNASFASAVTPQNESSVVGTSLGSMLPLKSFATLIFGVFAPLVSQRAGVLGPHYDAREFWDLVRVHEISRVILDQRQLRSIVMRGKPKQWSSFPELRLIVVPNGVVSSRIVDEFLRTFAIPIHLTYFQTEGGGVLSVARHLEPASAALFGEAPWVAKSGRALPGVKLSIVDESGNEVPPRARGEIVVRSAGSMTRYAATPAGDAFVGPSMGLHSGDVGVLSPPTEGNELVVLGRSKELVSRQGVTVNLALIEAALSEIRGIQWAQAVAFEHEIVGCEIGALVVQNRAANLTEADVLDELRLHLQPEQLPRIILFISGDPPQSVEAVQQRFRPFARKSFK